MKKTLLAVVSISVAALAYANTSSDSSELLNQQCKISAEAVSTLKGLRYGNTAIRKDVSSLINLSLKVQENKDAAQITLNRMVDDRVYSTSALEVKYCS
jgi:limonene-1,2-epoxide hydrolase